MERKDGYLMNPDYEQAKRMALENVVQKKNRKAVYDFQCRHAGKHCNRKRKRK
jgi:hypothetical protein